MPENVGGGGWTYLGTTTGTITYTYNATVVVPDWSTTASSTSGTYTINCAPYNVANTINYVQVPQVDENERQRRMEALTAARQQATAAQRERSRERAEAIGRATSLLMAVLDEYQRESYRRTGAFDVIGSRGTLYRIHTGSVGNVEWISPDGEGGRLCAHPSMNEHWLPDQDVAVAQMLALTTDEAAFVRLANVHRGRRPVLAAV